MIVNVLLELITDIYVIPRTFNLPKEDLTVILITTFVYRKVSMRTFVLKISGIQK